MHAQLLSSINFISSTYQRGLYVLTSSMLYTPSTALSTVQHLRTFPALESWTSTHSRRRAKKELWDLFRVCKKNIYLRLFPFKHLLNSIFYRKVCLTERNAKEKLESKVAGSILGCIKSVTGRVLLCYSALVRPPLDIQMWWRIWGAPHVCVKADQAGTVLPGKEKAQGSLINCIKGILCKEDRDSLYPVVTGDRTAGSGHKMKLRKLCLNIRHIFPLWRWLNIGTGCPKKMRVGHTQKLSGCGPGQTSPGGPAWVGSRTRRPPEVPCNLNHPVILW